MRDCFVFYIWYTPPGRDARARTPRRRARDVAIDCDCDAREIAADDGRRCARGEASATRRDATEARVTSRGFDVASRGRDANDGRERVTDARTISKRVVDVRLDSIRERFANDSIRERFANDRSGATRRGGRTNRETRARRTREDGASRVAGEDATRRDATDEIGDEDARARTDDARRGRGRNS